MVLTERSLVHYLLDRGLLDLDSIVDGDLQVAEGGGRNRHFRVTHRRRPGLFVKQVRGWGPDERATLTTEARCYHLAASDPGFSPLATLVPGFRAFDSSRSILVVELVAGGENLGDALRRRATLPAGIARTLGEGLGRWHRAASGLASGHPALTSFPRRQPWILSAPSLGPAATGPLSPANLRLLEIVRGHPGFEGALAGLRSRWQPWCLIHGDLKWENVLVVEEGDGRPGVRLVDWEMASLGDGLWDAAGVVQAFLTTWVLSMPAGALSPGETEARARIPLSALLPSLHAFWQGYLDATETPESVARGLAPDLAAAAGARLIQTAYELSFRDAELRPTVVFLLQLALNLLTRPREAARDLLEIG